MYIIPITGLYVISYSLATAVNQNTFVSLQVNQVNVAGLHLYIGGGNTDEDVEVLSKTLVLKLKENDRVAAVLDKDHDKIYSDTCSPTSMKGFLYKPYRCEPVSWRVAINKDGCTSGPLDPVHFDAVFVNEGSGWDKIFNRFVVPLPGVYYLQLSAGMCEKQPTKMELMVNGFPILNVYRQFTREIFWDTRSRAVILQLQQGDKLHIRLPSNYYLWSNGNSFTEFSGFRLYEYDKHFN